MTSDLAYKSATELKALILAREVSPIEVVQASLERLDAVETARPCNHRLPPIA